MADLKTTFAGLTLKNPAIISSSGLTNSAAKNASWKLPVQSHCPEITI